MPRAFDEEIRARIDFVARECARVLEGAERIEREEAARAPIERATSHLERMHAFSSMLARAVMPLQVVDAIVEAGVVAAAASTCTLFLVSKDGKTVCPARVAGESASTSDAKSELPIDQPLRTPLLDAVRDGAPVWVESQHQLEDRYPNARREASAASESALACVPMLDEGRVIGVLQFRWDGARRFFEDERSFLRVLARSAGQAVVRTRLYAVEKRAKEAAEASQRRSDLLAQASTLLGSSLEYSVTLAALVKAVVPGFADWCIVEIQDEVRRGAAPLVSHVEPTKEPLIGALARLHHELYRGDVTDQLTTVARTGVSQLHADISVDMIRARLPNPEQLIPLYESLGLTASILVPICARGRVLGAMALNLATAERRYDNEDLKAAEELGRRIGIAIDNARLFRDAREIDRKKDEFLAMLSHELRNPLAPILAALDVMNARDPSAFANERAIVSRHVRHLVRLVDDLLDVSRVTRGIIQLDKGRFAIADVVAEAVEMASPLVRERGHRLTVSAAPGLDVIADRVRLSQAVGNLLLNAAKYTEPGGEIGVTAYAEGIDAVVRVRDTGCGIAAETLPRVFDLFVQGERTLDRAKGGLGIGLTVVKGIVELHGGSVSAHSEGVGRGTEIVVRIPLAPPLTVAAAPAPPPSPAPTLAAEAPLAVLVVDDNEDAAVMVEATLEILGCTAKIAHDGASALAALAGFTPDLVLLDIGLPDIDGFEVARRLRRDGSAASARIVAVTGYGQESDRRRSKDAGCDEHLVKPIGLDELTEIVTRCRQSLTSRTH
jgi:signal transduction histidine kinase/CheY-like chemotaxis protein